MGQDYRRARTAYAARCPKARLQVHSHNGGVQSRPSAKAHRSHNITSRSDIEPFRRLSNDTPSAR